MAREFGGYLSYNFVDKDPLIDYVRTLVNDTHMTQKELSLQSGVNPQTIRKWLYGETKRPTAAALNAVLHVLGYKLNITATITPMGVKPTTERQAVKRAGAYA